MRLLFWLVPVAFFALFYVLPIGSILEHIVADPGSIGKLQSVWPKIWSPLKFTVWQAVLSTLITMLIGVPAAFVFARFRFPGKGLMKILTTIPFIMPTVVVAAGFSSLIGPQGWLNVLLMNLMGLQHPPLQILNTIYAIVLAHVFYNTTVFIRVLGGAWSQLDPKMEYAARSLGASAIKVFKEITLPLLRPAFFSALLLVFLFDFTSFAVILLLGGPGFATLEVEIYTQALHLLNLPMAGLLSFVQLMFTLMLTVGYSRLNQRKSLALQPRDPIEVEKPAVNLAEKMLLWGVNLVLLLLLISPLISLAIRSILAPANNAGVGRLSLRYYTALFVNQRSSLFYVPPVEAIINSLWIGFLTITFTLLVGFFAAKTLSRRTKASRLFDILLMLPLGTSAVTLGLGFLLVFNRPPLIAGHSFVLIPLAHSLVALPFVVRILQPAIESIPDIYTQSAAILGASPWQVWRQIELPLLARSFLSGGIFAFTISIGEFGATTFLSTPDLPTIPVAIYRYLSQPGALNYGQAMAMATILMVVCALAIMVVEKLRLPGISDF
ncbi:MAG: hypothetical protein BGO78_03575 [Chloroflexi bacterium 44-23]|nr:MAG: hypothetical protein BGO78_03575 [Chloroflexi bacterium 44-23]